MPCMCDICVERRANGMSRRNRTIRDWMSDAFFARDKATFVRAVDAAEEEQAALLAAKAPAGAAGANGGMNGGANGEDDPLLGQHQEPDGDEGKHPQNVHIHVEHAGESGKNGSSLGDRVARLEDGMKGINDKLGMLVDALPPEFLKGKEGDDDKTGDAAGRRSSDADLGGDVTEGGSDKDGGTPDGGLTMKAPPSSSAELVEADPALAQEKTRMGDAAYKARTVQAMGNVMRDTIARAEIMAPGIKFGTLDAGGIDKWSATQQRLHTLRRNALKQLMTTDQGKAVLGSYAATADRMSYDATRLIFNDASEKVRSANNAANVPSPMFGDTAGSIRSYRSRQEAIIGSINDANHEHWEKQGVKMGPKRVRAA